MRYILFLLILTIIPLNIISMQSSTIQEKKADTWRNRFYSAWLALSGRQWQLSRREEIETFLKKREESQYKLFVEQFKKEIEKWKSSISPQSEQPIFTENAVFVKGLKMSQDRISQEMPLPNKRKVVFTLEPSPAVYLFTAKITDQELERSKN